MPTTETKSDENRDETSRQNGNRGGTTACGSRAGGRDRSEIEALAAELYRSERDRLLRIACSNALNHEDAEESLQEAFMAFCEKYDPAGGAPPLAWITLTLKRECWARRRREHLERRAGQEADRGSQELGTRIAELPSLEDSPHERAERSERVVAAREQFAQLKPDERRALALRALGYSYREIGAHTGWSHTKINRCIAEGRVRLRQLAAAAPE